VEAALNFHASLLMSGVPFSNLEFFDSEFSALLTGFLNNAGCNIPESLARRGWQVFVSFEGSAVVMERIGRELQHRSAEARAERGETLDMQGSQQLSEALREAFDWLRRAAPGVALLRIVLPHSKAGDVMELLNLPQQSPLHSALVLRACNVIYLSLLADGDDEQSNVALERGISELFSRAEAKKGSATLLHTPRWLEGRINVWGAKRPDFPLMQRVKQAFDPQNIFAPGRFAGGI
jgi:FAD/FMN-containing dehydrogenase